jgi:hypothetical protein
VVFQPGSVIMFDGPPSYRANYTNNLCSHNTYGIHGSGYASGTASIAAYDLGGTVTKNVLAGGLASSYPEGNYFPPTMMDVGFVNLSGGDYHLSLTSPYRGAGSDGKDLGANIDLINTGTAGVLEGRPAN